MKGEQNGENYERKKRHCWRKDLLLLGFLFLQGWTVIRHLQPLLDPSLTPPQGKKSEWCDWSVWKEELSMQRLASSPLGSAHCREHMLFVSSQWYKKLNGKKLCLCRGKSVVTQHCKYPVSKHVGLRRSVYKSDCCYTLKPFSPTSPFEIKLTFLCLPGFSVLNSSRGKCVLFVTLSPTPATTYTH